MAIKIDGTNDKVIFLAGSAQATTLTVANAPTPWTLKLPPNAGAAGEVLVTDGTGATTWGAGGGGALTVADDTATNATRYPLFADITTGLLTTSFVASTEYTFNPSTGQLNAFNVASTHGMDLNFNTIPVSYTLPANYNSVSGGPITVPAGVIVTVVGTSRWTTV